MDLEKSDIQVIAHKYLVKYQHPDNTGAYQWYYVYFVTIEKARKFVRELCSNNEHRDYKYNQKISLHYLQDGENNKETKLKK